MKTKKLIPNYYIVYIYLKMENNKKPLRVSCIYRKVYLKIHRWVVNLENTRGSTVNKSTNQNELKEEIFYQNYLF